MISTRDGDWWVTSPLYVGSDSDIAQAIVCRHAKYSVLPPTPAWPDRKKEMKKSGIEDIVIEKCDGCCARRFRYKSEIAHEEVKL